VLVCKYATPSQADSSNVANINILKMNTLAGVDRCCLLSIKY
jgi:hypothetical protein